MEAAETAASPRLEAIARVCHEANRAWQEAVGEEPSPHWDEAPPEHRSSSVRGVQLALAGATPEALHQSWCETRIAQGWKYGERKDEELKTHPCLVPYEQLPEDQRKKDALFQAIARTLGCGMERWDVKTLTDPDASSVHLSDPPIDSSVTILGGLQASTDPTSRVPDERDVYRVKGTITLVKEEADSDFHIVLADADGSGHTMIVEAPCPGCCDGSIVLDQITAVRQKVQQQFPEAAQGQVVRNLNVPVTVTGVLFFDRIHGQTGVAPNGAELHPVLDIDFGGGQ